MSLASRRYAAANSRRDAIGADACRANGGLSSDIVATIFARETGAHADAADDEEAVDDADVDVAAAASAGDRDIDANIVSAFECFFFRGMTACRSFATSAQREARRRRGVRAQRRFESSERRAGDRQHVHARASDLNLQFLRSNASVMLGARYLCVEIIYHVDGKSLHLYANDDANNN
jgi:hypothetical protein